MKIIEDKVTVYPPHAICKADILVILSALPADWTATILSVRLSAAQNDNPMIIAKFSEFDGSLLIKSRGRGKEEALRAILAELAARVYGVTFRWGHRLQERDESRIERTIAPLVDEIYPQLSKKKVWLDTPNP